MKIPTAARPENLHCNAALQIRADRVDELMMETSGEAKGAMLYSICSL
jgi:hypothetical protein